MSATPPVAHVVGPQGYPIDVAVRNVAFDALEGAAIRAIAFEKALKDKGLKPVEPPSVVVNAPAAVGNGRRAGGLVMTQNDDGTWSCPEHGVGKFVPPGKNREGKDYPGFWTCREKDCNARPPRSRS